MCLAWVVRLSFPWGEYGEWMDWACRAVRCSSTSGGVALPPSGEDRLPRRPPPPAARWLNDDLVGARPAAAAASGTSGRWGAPTAAWTTSASCPTAASPPTWPARRWRTTPPGAEPRATRPSRWSVGAAPDPVQSLRTLERRRLPRTEPRCDGSAPVYCAPTSAPPWLPHSSR